MMVLSEEQRKSDSVQEQTNIKEQQQTLQKQIRTLDNYMQCALPSLGDDFVQKLCKEVITLEKPGKIFVKTAMYNVSASYPYRLEMQNFQPPSKIIFLVVVLPWAERDARVTSST
jgi:hypothetical protein